MVGFILFCLSVLYSLPGAAAPFRLALETVAPPDTMYLGEEVSFQIKLLDRIGVTDVRIIPADWQNVDLFLAPSPKDETILKNQTSYNVKTLSFSLVAKTTGRISLPPFCLSALAPTMISVRDLPPDIKITSNGRIEICTQPFSFDVKALPDHSVPLFAAAQVELFDGIVPQSSSVQQGTPVKRSLVLTARGTLPVYLPDFQIPEQENVRIYKGKTDRTMITGKNNLIAAMRQTIVFVPQQTGKVILPELSVFWLNTQTQRIEESKIPSHVLTILPAEAQPDEQKTLPVFAQTAQNTADQRGIAFFTARFLGIFFVFVVLVGAGTFFLKRYFNHKALIRNVVRACLADDPEKTAAALLTWGRAKFPDRRIISLSDIRNAFNGQAVDFSAELEALELFLYGTGRFARHLTSTKKMAAENLLKAFYAADRTKIRRQSEQKKYLPDLYPDQ